ncbi:MAG: DUF937 domain-containing protein, partial [bacterium]
MNIIQELLKAGEGQAVGQLANQFGLDTSAVEKALANLVPAIAGGIKKTASSKNGLESLISKMGDDKDLTKAVDFPDILGKPDSTQAGNEILGDIFGSKDVSRTVAKQTAQSTGVDFGILKKMLPLVAGLVMSSLSKTGQASGGGLGELLGGLAQPKPQPQPRGGLGGLLSGIFGTRKAAKAPPSSGIESLLDFDG